jgi:hypothetical protein
MVLGFANRMQFAFWHIEALNVGNRRFHFHANVPVVHDRSGFPPDVPTVPPEALISGGVGYAFLIFRN